MLFLTRLRLTRLFCFRGTFKLGQLFKMNPEALAVVDEELLTFADRSHREQTHLKPLLAIRELDERPEFDVGFGSDTAVVVDKPRFVAPVPAV